MTIQSHPYVFPSVLSDQDTSGPDTSSPDTSSSDTSDCVTSDRIVSDCMTSDCVTSNRVTSDCMTLDCVTSDCMTSHLDDVPLSTIDAQSPCETVFDSLSSNQANEATTLHQAGMKAYHQENYITAIACLQKSAMMDLAMGNASRESITLTYLGNAYQQQGQARPAMCCFWDAWMLCNELGDRPREAMNLMHLGHVYEQEEMPLSALDAYQRAIALLHITAPAVVDTNMFKIAQALERAGETDQALDWYRQMAETLSKQILCFIS